MSMKNRIYNDYFMPNRYKEYEEILDMFIKEGYSFICVKDYKLLYDNKKFIILRHDIDSDIKIAKKMFRIEKKLGIKSTYYFRLSTIDKKFIKEINEYGSEVGYHYEEIAQYCRDNRNINKIFVKENIAKIKENMIKNVKFFEEENNIKLCSIVAHGDFINRKINITNKFIYDDELEKKLKLIEAYDIEDKIDFRTADDMYPKFWKENPIEAIKQKKNRILILVHPRWWKRAPIERVLLDFRRLIEELKFK